MLDLTERILKYLDGAERVDTLDLVEVLGEDHQKIVGGIKSIQATGDLILVEQTSKKFLELTEEGLHVSKHGSHEANIFQSIPAEGIMQSKLIASSPNAKIGFSKAMSLGWIFIDKSVNPPIVQRKVETIEDCVKTHLLSVIDKKNDIPEKIKQDYVKRKLLQETTVKSFIVSKGPNFATSLAKLPTDITFDMISSGSWQNHSFKEYNFNALGTPLESGHFHPLLKVKTEFRNIFFEMGFSEMPTNNYIESSFWNFDALFQPQQHPARDAHDTFFLLHPEKSSKFPMKYLERVKKVHSKGGYGSQGYGYDWQIGEAQKNLLRTHTTAVSARMLYKLANQPGGFHPVKYFSIDKVFRNETLDATHLAEFHQVEGVIAGFGLTLGDLIGTLYEFFNKLGITKLVFKPAYNPYTEPSMEIFCFHTGLNKWIEVGNSGIFRPEMLAPMGIPSHVSVIAWGLSLERPTMIKYNISNIRDLVGPKVDLAMVKTSPICRLEK